MTDELKRTSLKWIGITTAIMFILPFAVAKFASECAGMALCMMLFLVINPIYSIILGIVAGRNLKALWNLPLISAVAFLAGTWLFFDIPKILSCRASSTLTRMNFLRLRRR